MKKMSMNPPCDWTMLLARVLIVGIFATSLISKLTDFSGNVGYANSAGLPIPGELLIVGAIILELVGVITILAGWQMKWGAIALIVFTISANFMFHLPTDPNQMIMFLKNWAIIGGLLVLMMNRPGKISLENYMK